MFDSKYAHSNGSISPNFPARLDVGHLSKLLGFPRHDISTLIGLGLLRPLGKPAKNGPKYFAACEIMMLCQDRKWLDRATQAISSRWKRANSRRTSARPRKASVPRQAEASMRQAAASLGSDMLERREDAGMAPAGS